MKEEIEKDGLKRVLGLDLGTTSIGWALVEEAQDENAKSKIIKTGVRIIQYDNYVGTDSGKESKDPVKDFSSGRGISPNAGRTGKRGTRRNLQRYKQRRDHLFKILLDNKILNTSKALNENGKDSTFSLLRLRAKAATEEIGLHDFARVLFAINKKRGYKSNRKAKDENDENDGIAVDGMEIAKKLHHENLTPGELMHHRLKENKKTTPEFYPSDLENEFNKIWENQKEYYSDILTDKLKEELSNKTGKQTWAICKEPFGIEGIPIKGKGNEIKLEKYKLRKAGLTEKLELEHLAIVLQEIRNQITNTSGYLGAISDRSKELYFNNQTVGQYLYNQIIANPHTRLKNQVFYRKDYEDEFDRIWEVQSQNRKDLLTDQLKAEIKETVIFYQRRLKSQKGQIAVCELEGKEIELKDKKSKPILNKDGKPKIKLIGPKVIPKSSPLFQEFKVWQILNNLKFLNIETQEEIKIADCDEELEIRNAMFKELTLKGKLTSNEVIKATFKEPKKWEVKNYKDVEGNNTIASLYKAYMQMIELSGHENSKSNPKKHIKEVFENLEISTGILEFNSDLESEAFQNQPLYKLWHLLYSFEGDKTESGHGKLIKALKREFNIPNELSKPLINLVFKDDYGKLSAKAIKKILPYMKEGNEYSKAAALAGYNHSNSITKEKNKKRVLEDELRILPKNSLRNPVVEKILNQMINVVNAIINEYGKPDEVRIELARELKKSAKERAEDTSSIAKATKEHEEIRRLLEKSYPFNTGVRITKNDIIKYKLYRELATNGYKTIYTNTYVKKEELFSKKFDIEHIIPKSVLFDDSFSNKTLAVRDFNRYKSNKTGIDAVAEKYGIDSKDYNRYIDNVNKLVKEKKISKTKGKKLLMTADKIPDGFIDRDLRNSQFIAKKSQEILSKVFRYVYTTTGSITDKLRSDWQLVNVLQELNWNKYDKLELTYFEISKDGQKIPKIRNWTKRNDHRHHAMDAITVAFTKPSHVQYFNYLSARKDENHKKHKNIFAIENKETIVTDKKKRIVKPPIPLDEFRQQAKFHLENTLISFKSKNKVVTRNKNKTKTKKGFNEQTTLTPRGQLHKETVYGKKKYYETKSEKIGSKFDEPLIVKVTNKKHREALLKRLQENDNDPKKAFTGKNAPSKNPIWLDEHQIEQVPEKIKLVWLENQFTIRKEISPDLKIDKVVDIGVRKALQARLDKFGGNPKEAFVNLDKNPIWLNKEKGIKLKRVTITGVSNAEPLHTKKDHFGNIILDEEGKPIPNDFVSTGNNHHVAIYKDAKGNLHEKVVSFYEAVMAKNAVQHVIDKQYNEHLGWEFLFTMKQNEYFIFPNDDTVFKPNEIDLKDPKNYAIISPNLFRVQKISTKNYMFRHHLESQLIDYKETRSVTWENIRNCNGLRHLVKVRINHLGQIIKVGEY